jgi:hypothetical protein
MTKKDEVSIEEKVRIDQLAERIKLLFMFCYEMVGDIDLLEKVLDESYRRNSMALSAAPLLGSVGIDYEETEFDAQLHARRAKALLELVKALRDTEVDRMKFNTSKAKKAESAAMLRGILGIG